MVIMLASKRRAGVDTMDYSDKIREQVPISFLLGFFVSGVIGRWFDTYMYIPWLNDISYQVAATIYCSDQRVALRARLTIMRYLNLSWILMMRTISDRISSRFRQQSITPEGHRRRKSQPQHNRQDMLYVSGQAPEPKSSISPPLSSYPTSPLLPRPPSPLLSQPKPSTSTTEDFNFSNANNDLFEGSDDHGIRETLRSFNNDKKIQQTFGKIITEPEIRAFENIARRYFRRTRKQYLPEYWIPIQWAVRVVQKTALNGNIADIKIMSSVYNAIGKYRKSLQQMKTFSSLAMPLVYTQVVVIAVYSYFLCQIIATQYTERFVNETEVTLSMPLPLFSLFYFIFLMGWLKVALCVMNPFGEDYEDFETSEILDYNLNVSYRVALMDEAFYPDVLKRATFDIKTLAGSENDNLRDFLDSVSRDLDDIQFDENVDDIHNLEIRPGLFKQLKNKFRRTSDKARRFVDDKERVALPNPISY